MEEVKNYKKSESGNLVASKDLSSGDIVLSLQPLAAGPGRSKLPVCLGCNLRPEKGLISCSNCSWPVCSEQCQTSSNHSSECKILQKEACDKEGFSKVSEDYDFIHVLRLVLKIQSNPEIGKSIEGLKMDISKILLRNENKYGKDCDNKIVNKVKKLVLAPEDLIKLAICFIERYNIPLDCGSRAVYLDTSNIEHSCSPNTYFIGLPAGLCLYRAARQIKAGEAITSCRVPLDKCTYFRQKLMKEEGLNCNCSRCEDGSEYGTGYGSLVCSHCNGYMSPSNHHQPTNQWTCSKCGETKSGTECIATLEKLQKILDEAETDSKVGTADFYENILKREGVWSEVPNNSQLIFDVKKKLSYIYQYHKDFYFPQVDWLRRKKNYCKDWLDMAAVLFPGRSYARTLIDYEHVSATCALIPALREAGFQSKDVNPVCYEVIELCKAPMEMMIEEDDHSMHNAFTQMKMIATEAREEQRTRVYLNMFGDDDEDW